MQEFFTALAEVPYQWAEWSRHPSSGAASARVVQLRQAKIYQPYPVEWATKKLGERDPESGKAQTMVIVRWVGPVDHTSLPDFTTGPAVSPDGDYVPGAYAFDGTHFWRFSEEAEDRKMHYWSRTLDMAQPVGEGEAIRPKAKALWHMPAQRQALAELRLVFSPEEGDDETQE